MKVMHYVVMLKDPRATRLPSLGFQHISREVVHMSHGSVPGFVVGLPFFLRSFSNLQP